MKVIYEFIWCGDQSWWCEQILKTRDETFRVNARHNVYEYQSFVKVEIWTGGGWSEIHTVNGYALKAKAVSYAESKADASSFEPDVSDAIAVALRIVGSD